MEVITLGYPLAKIVTSRDGKLLSINGKEPFSFISAIYDDTAVMANYVVDNDRIIYVETSETYEDLGIMSINTAKIGTKLSVSMLEAAIDGHRILKSHDMLSPENDRRFRELCKAIPKSCIKILEKILYTP